MTFLLAQMMLALIVAAIFGGAAGWIIHRASFSRQLDELHNALGRQHQQMTQMQSEVAMLNDDYDELKRRSNDELRLLREENQQIPVLTTNLEKSQLLVRQMLQRHEAKVRELNGENQKLTQKLAAADLKEQQSNQRAAEEDRERRLAGAEDTQTSTAASNTPVASPEPSDESTVAAQGLAAGSIESSYDSQPDSESPAHEPETAATDTIAHRAAPAANPVISNARNIGSWASVPLDRITESVRAADASSALSPRESDAFTLTGGTENLDEVHVVVEDDLSDITDFDGQDAMQMEDDSPFPAGGGPVELDAERTSEWSGIAGEIDELNDTGAAELNDVDQANERSLAAAAQPDSARDATEADPFDQVIEVNDEMQRDLDREDGNEAVPENPSEDDQSLFEPVDQQDDLQQIFGIGPQTEKALNDLGITSYAQLAQLRHHEIEAIANALHIVPGRIERDDWVGNARKQLEDVLEEL